VKNTALLDGASIHAAGALCQRLGSQLAVRPINVLALSALIESYILFENIQVPQESWDYFSAYAPTDWLIHLKRVITPIKMDCDNSGLREFLTDPYLLWVYQGILHADQELFIHLDYMTYVGRDFGTYSTQTQEEVNLIEQILREHWKSDDPGLDWHYNASNCEHIDAIHAAWRGCIYSKFCAENAMWYVPHELRGLILDFHARLRGSEHQEPLINRALTTIKELYVKHEQKTARGVGKNLFPRRPESELLWTQLKMPLLAGRILQSSETLYEVFDRARDAREKYAPFRDACSDADLYEQAGNPEKAVKLYTEIVRVFERLGKEEQASHVNWSLSFSIPWGMSLTGAPEKSGTPRHLSFIRDMYNSRMLPFTFRTDLIRLLDQDPAEWLLKYGRGEERPEHKLAAEDLTFADDPNRLLSRNVLPARKRRMSK